MLAKDGSNLPSITNKKFIQLHDVKISIQSSNAYAGNPYEGKNEPYRPPSNNPYKPNANQPTEMKNRFRMELGAASISLLFVLSIWRTIVLHDAASTFMSPLMNLLTTIPLKCILMLNIVSLVTNLVKPLYFKNILRLTFGLNILKEAVDLTYNAVMIVFNKSFLISQPIFPREYYLGRLLMNLWFLLAGISQLKSRWVLQLSQKRQDNAAKANTINR